MQFCNVAILYYLINEGDWSTSYDIFLSVRGELQCIIWLKKVTEGLLLTYVFACLRSITVYFLIQGLQGNTTLSDSTSWQQEMNNGNTTLSNCLSFVFLFLSYINQWRMYHMMIKRLSDSRRSVWGVLHTKPLLLIIVYFEANKKENNSWLIWILLILKLIIHYRNRTVQYSCTVQNHTSALILSKVNNGYTTLSAYTSSRINSVKKTQHYPILLLDREEWIMQKQQFQICLSFVFLFLSYINQWRMYHMILKGYLI